LEEAEASDEDLAHNLQAAFAMLLKAIPTDSSSPFPFQK
jgi:hypothetical protein